MSAPVQLACCPTCGRAYRARAVAVRDLSDAERASMSDAQLIEHFKSTGPMKDVEFFLRLSDLPEALRQAGEELLGLLRRQNGAPSAQSRRFYVLLHQRWREHRWVVERATRKVARTAARKAARAKKTADANRQSDAEVAS